MVLALQRVENLEPTLATLEAEDAKIKDVLRDFERDLANKDQLLFAALATQEAVLTERIEEIKGLFVRSNEVFLKKSDAATDAAGAALPQGAQAAPYETATAIKGLFTSNM